MAALNSNIRFIFGIILIFCGWVICFDLFLLIIGIPFFLLGTILVLFSKKSWVVKIITVVIPIVLWFVIFEIILHEISKKDAIRIILTHDFSGQVRIVYGQPNGSIPPRENGRMILTIPANGILIVQPFITSGVEDVEYFMMDDKGFPEKINSVKTASEKIINRPAVFFEGAMSSVGKQGVSSDTPAELDYIYEAFFVFGNDSNKLQTYHEEMEKNPLTDSLVKIVKYSK